MKNFMGLSRLVVTAVVSLGVTISCSKEYDDSSLWSKLESHESRLSALEQMCSRMNSDLKTLSSLVNALSASDMVTSVVPIMEGNTQLGWTIEFTHRAPISIFNGRNGADGTPGRDGTDGRDGVDGRSPLIGVADGGDGNWYWTLDGEWLRDGSGERIKANGTDGRDGIDGAPGKDGVNGQDGTDGAPGKDGVNGADGVTPLLIIKEGSWYASYDNGSSWEYLGKTSETQSSGCLILSISESEDSVIFNLASGQTLCIPKYKDEKPLEIIVANCDGKVQAGGSLDVQFTLAHCKGEAIVKAIVGGGWKADIRLERTSGTIQFLAPEYSDNCEAVLVAQDERRCAVIAIIPLISQHSGDSDSSDNSGSSQGYAVSADGESLRIFIADTSFIMNRVHAGTFTMGDGTQYENQGAKYGYTNPKHEVTLTQDFWITESALGETLLTKFSSIDQTMIEYAGGSYVHNTRNFIDISNAEPVLRAISKDCSLPFRLPTEAEAEYSFAKGKSSGGTQVSDWMAFNNGWFSWGFDISADAVDPVGPPDSTPMVWPATNGCKTLSDNGFQEWYKIRKGSGKPTYRYTTRRYPIMLVLPTSATR